MGQKEDSVSYFTVMKFEKVLLDLVYSKPCLEQPCFTFVGIYKFRVEGGCVVVLVMFLCLVASSYTPVCQASAQYT